MIQNVQSLDFATKQFVINLKKKNQQRAQDDREIFIAIDVISYQTICLNKRFDNALIT